jgi:DNA-binding NarL/FixJ family response regulator
VGTLGFVQTGPGGLTEARLRTLYVEQGLSKKAIARELGCSDTTVAAAVRHFRLSRPERPKIS